MLLREPRRARRTSCSRRSPSTSRSGACCRSSPSGSTPAFFDWASLLVAVSLPATAQRFFQAFLGDDAGPPPLSRSTVVGAGAFYARPVLLAVRRAAAHDHLVPRRRSWPTSSRPLPVGLLSLRALPRDAVARREDAPPLPGGRRLRDRHRRRCSRRCRTGPRFGNVFIIIYMYFLSQTLFRYRLLDLNELLGRMVVLGDAGAHPGGDLRPAGRAGSPPDEHGLFFFNTLVASFVIVILFEPLRARVEGPINRWMFQREVRAARRIESCAPSWPTSSTCARLVPRVLAALEESRRVTHASVYLVDPDGSGYELAGPRRAAPGRALRRHRRTAPSSSGCAAPASISIEELEREHGRAPPGVDRGAARACS